MKRRTFLSVMAVTGYGGLGWLLQACEEGMKENGLGRERDPADPSPSTTASTTKKPPTDDDEYVPGSPDAGAGPVVETPSLPNASWESRVKQLEGAGVVYTEAAPGPWAGKERSHVPTIIADTVLTNRVTVLVNHVMQKAGTLAYPDAGAADATMGDAMAMDDADAAPPPPVDAAPTVLPEHYVTTIYVKSDTGVVLGLIEMNSSDPSPPSVTFVCPPGTKSVTAYEFCNLHGLWASKPLTLKG